jgi:hypothetical protein
MRRDVIGFTSEPEDAGVSSQELTHAEIARALSYAYSPKLQPRPHGNSRWIALAVIIGAAVAMAFVNFFLR